MNKSHFILLLFMFLLFEIPASYAAPVHVHDDLGRLVSLDKPARRIVSLAPHAVEMLFAAGAGDRIVATVSYSDYPVVAKKIPRIGSYTAVDVERVLALQPDLVIAWESGNRKKEIEKLIQLGLTVFINEPRSIADVANSIERFGKLTATETVANRFVKKFRQHYHRLQKTYQKRSKVRMFYQVWNDPLMTINGQHLISAVMRLCGAENIFRDMSALSARVSLESVIAAKPEIIIAGGNKNRNAAWLTTWQAWKNLPAVRHDQLYFINPDLLHRQGPRILEGAEIMCRDVEQARAANEAGE